MTFLNPLVLFGLVAAAIPLILHLLNLRKLRTVEFSTLDFLKELQRTSIRRLKLRQILLLVVRTLLIAAIVFAFARPALRGSMLGTIGTHARTSVVILLDDTFSMGVRDERGEVFAQAKDAARQLIGLLKEGDEAALLKMSDVPEATMESPTHDFSALLTMIGESTISFSSGSMEDAMRLSAKLLERSRNANREIYILSDLQRTMFPHNVSAGQKEAIEDIFPPATKFFVLNAGARETPNAAIDSVTVLSRIFEKEKPVQLSARVRNYGAHALSDHVVSAYLGGERVAQHNTDLPAWGAATADFTVTPKRTGLIAGYIGIEDDEIDIDNRRYFVLSIPERVGVALVSPSRDDIRFVSLALTAAAEGSHGLFNVQHISAQQFPLLDLRRIDVVVFSNVPAFTPADAERVRQFVEEGGGVILFPGNSSERENYNATILQRLGVPPYGERSGSPGSTASALMFQRIDYDHALLTGIFVAPDRQRRVTPESPQVYVNLAHQTGRHGRTIIGLSDQTAFLSEYRLGNGIVFVFSSAPVLGWTDFPVKGMFAPLMHRAVLYAGAFADQPTSYTTGDEPVIRVKVHTERVGAQRYALRLPDGGEHLLQPHLQSTFAGTMLLFSGNRMVMPGIHEIRAGQDLITKFAVNVPGEESDLRKISISDANSFWGRFGIDDAHVQYIPPGSAIDQVVLQARFGVELWKFLVAFALMLMVAEMALARDSKKGESGT